MNFYPLEQSDNLFEGYSKLFVVAGEQLLLVHTQGHSYLISNRCPHDGYSLKKASVNGGCIQCPKHKICFDLLSGQALGGDVVAGIGDLMRYPLEYMDDQLGVDIDTLHR